MQERPAIPIRNATPDDISRMLEIERAAGGASHWGFTDYQRIFEPDSPTRFGLLAGEDPPQGFLVALAIDRDWEIENLAVSLQSRRRGFARALITELLRRAAAAEADSVILEVRRSNQPARSLYEALGFRAITSRSGYYHDPMEDAVIYRVVPAILPAAATPERR